MILLLALFVSVVIIGLLIRITDGDFLVMGLGLLFYPITVVLEFYYHWSFLLVFWLIMAVLNTFVCKILDRIEGVKEPWVQLLPLMLNSIMFWPIQFWTVFDKDIWSNAISDDLNIDPEILKQIDTDKPKQVEAEKQLISQLPTTVKGTVSFEHHLDSDAGHDMLWLLEIPDVPLYITSKLYVEIGIEEGKQFQFDLTKEIGTEVGIEDDVAWVVSGSEV